MDPKQILNLYQNRVEKSLLRWLPTPNTNPAHLHTAMHYSTTNGGKRIRPTLTYATGHAIGVPLDHLDGPACAIELIHCYSLVHDDLPAMDNDDLRRGIPTCHKQFDEATAILVGDALQALAFYILTQDSEIVVPDSTRLEMIKTLAHASGSRGLVGGQAIDLNSIGSQLNILELENMHIHKTGALIRTSVLLGAMSMPDVEQALLDQLDHYAKCVGLGFQIQDDILDIEGDTQTLGKTQGADTVRAKPTYPSCVGMSEAKQKLKDLYEEALASIRELDERADLLRWVADYAMNRKY